MMSENVAEDFISMQNVSDDKQTTSQSLKEAREVSFGGDICTNLRIVVVWIHMYCTTYHPFQEIDELRRFSSNQRTELDANEVSSWMYVRCGVYRKLPFLVFNNSFLPLRVSLHCEPSWMNTMK